MTPVRETAHDVRDLDRGEHLVLFGFRLAAIGHADCPALQRTFCGAMGGEGDAALCDLLVLVRMIAAAGRRRVRLHMPGCGGLTDDERGVLAVVAAAQASLLQGDETALRQGLSRLLDATPGEACLIAAQSVAAALTLAGLDLPDRQGVETAGVPVTLH